MNSFERIVLIDDNEDDNFFHEIVIRKAGFQGELRVFENGVDAGLPEGRRTGAQDLRLCRHQHAHAGWL